MTEIPGLMADLAGRIHATAGRALHGAGVVLHEIQPASVIYPKDGPLSGHFHHSDPVVLAYWLTGEIGPSVERAIARYHGAGN